MNYQNPVIYYITIISYFRNLPGGFLPSRLIAASRRQGPGGGLPVRVQRANTLSQLEGRDRGPTGDHREPPEGENGETNGESNGEIMVNPLVNPW